MATITTIKEKIISLDQASFQILCDAYLSKEGYPNIVALGTKAGAQKTTLGTPDTYFFTAEKKYVFVEYTTQQSSLITKIEDDLDKCLDKSTTGIDIDDISEIIYCHTSSNISPGDDKKFRDRCEALGIKLTIIGIDVLAEQLLNKYPKLVKDHLGLTIDTEQIQKAEDCKNKFIKADGTITVNIQKIQVALHSMGGTWLHGNTMKNQPIYMWSSALSVCMFSKNPLF